MRIFVTGATGFIGRSLLPTLLSHSHTILALSRNETSASKIRRLGAEPFPGDIEDLDSLRRGAEAADAVIHLAFILDPTDFTAGVRKDRAAIEALAEAVKGTGKALVYASGTMVLPVGTGRVMDEGQAAEVGTAYGARAEVDAVVRGLEGVRSMTMRFPPSVHGMGDQGLVGMMVAAARRNGVVVFVGEGRQRWPAVHVGDVAECLRSAVEGGREGAVYHVVAEEGIEQREIARTIGEGLRLKVEGREAEEALGMLGFLAHTIQRDHEVSSEGTRRELGWEPKGPGLLDDLRANYFA